MSIAQTAVRDDGTLHQWFIDTFWDDAKAFAKFSEYVWPNVPQVRLQARRTPTEQGHRRLPQLPDAPLHGANKPIKLWFGAIFIA